MKNKTKNNSYCRKVSFGAHNELDYYYKSVYCGGVSKENEVKIVPLIK